MQITTLINVYFPCTISKGDIKCTFSSTKFHNNKNQTNFKHITQYSIKSSCLQTDAQIIMKQRFHQIVIDADGSMQQWIYCKFYHDFYHNLPLHAPTVESSTNSSCVHHDHVQLTRVRGCMNATTFNALPRFSLRTLRSFSIAHQDFTARLYPCVYLHLHACVPALFSPANYPSSTYLQGCVNLPRMHASQLARPLACLPLTVRIHVHRLTFVSQSCNYLDYCVKQHVHR